MFRWLTQHPMHGGMVFGPPGWTPGRIETTFDAQNSAPTEPATTQTPPPTPPAKRRDLAEYLQQLGIGATSPTIPALAAQLKELGDRPLDGVILNLLPPQPESALGGALSRLAWDEIAAGFGAIAGATGARRRVVALDRHDHHAARAWCRPNKQWKALGITPSPRVYRQLNRYPQADPTLLLWTLFGKKLRVQAMPTTVGWLMLDAVTCWALGRHVRGGQKYTERPVQLFVQDAEPRLVLARLGESLSDLCRRNGVTTDLRKQQVIVNGMLTGKELSADACVDSATESVALRERAVHEKPSPCIACGWCVDICPTGLTPVALLELAQQAAAGGRGGGGACRGRRAKPAIASPAACAPTSAPRDCH